MQSDNILKRMVKDEMTVVVLDPSTYEEVECHVEGSVEHGFDLVSNDAQAPDDLESDRIDEPTGFVVPIKKFIAHGTQEMFFICGYDNEVYEVSRIY